MNNYIHEQNIFGKNNVGKTDKCISFLQQGDGGYGRNKVMSIGTKIHLHHMHYLTVSKYLFADPHKRHLYV